MKKVQVRLLRKFAEMIDGVDLSRNVVGQTLRLVPAEARLLVAEGWAELIEQKANPDSVPLAVSLAADVV